MIINSISGGNIAALVWAAAGRTLTADPATDAGVGAIVWGHAGRTLTGVAAWITHGGAMTVNLPAGTLADLRPAAGVVRTMTVHCDTIIPVPVLSLHNGAALADVGVKNLGTGCVANVIGNATQGAAVSNTSANPDTYSYAYKDETE